MVKAGRKALVFILGTAMIVSSLVTTGMSLSRASPRTALPFMPNGGAWLRAQLSR
jgi:hypothetical protein